MMDMNSHRDFSLKRREINTKSPEDLERILNNIYTPEQVRDVMDNLGYAKPTSDNSNKSILGVIDILLNERKCVETASSKDGCDRDCANCKLLRNTDDILYAYDVAISMLRSTNEYLLKEATGPYMDIYHNEYIVLQTPQRHNSGKGVLRNLTKNKLKLTFIDKYSELPDVVIHPRGWAIFDYSHLGDRYIAAILSGNFKLDVYEESCNENLW